MADGDEEKLPAAARRALAEARARRSGEVELPKEFPDRGVPDPVRYGDWEKKGLASDF